MGGASVRINGIDAPMLRAFPFQLVAQMPMELAGASSAQIEVSVEGQPQSSEPRTFFVDAVSPGIFSTASSGAGQGAVVNVAELVQGIISFTAPADSSLPEARPARPGELVAVFCTGLGAVDPPVATGELAPGLHTTVEEVTATVDGLPAEVQFAGLAPGFAGLYQVNVRVPDGAGSGDDIPLVLTLAGKQSNTVTIAVSRD